MKAKWFIPLVFLSIINLGLNAQTSVTLIADYDAALGYHDGYPSNASTNWGTVTANGAFTMPGYNYGLNKNRSLIHFNLTAIPAGAVITSATLDLYAHGPHGSFTSGHTGANNSSYLQRVTQTWNHLTVTWNNQPTVTSTNQVLLPVSSSALQNYLNINVTQMVIDMLGTNNYGFMLRLVNEVSTNALLFASIDHADTLKHPRLHITYTLPPAGPCPNYLFSQTSICAGDSILLQGTYQKTAGIYFDTVPGTSTSDSIYVTALTLNYPTQTIQTHSMCAGDSMLLAGVWRKTPGFYTDYFTGSNGCDSIVHHQLTITIIDVTVTLSGTTLTATQTGATYQWIDCEQGFTPVAGATGQSFTPAANGSYAVMISKDGCIGVSPCTHVSNISIPQIIREMGVQLIPNPAGETVTLMLEQQIKEGLISINNLSGQQVMHTRFRESSTITLDINTLPSGVYLVFIEADGYTTTRKLVVR